MYDKVYFYNHFGAGDVFESREFVKAIMDIFPANNYFYAHGKHPSILADIPQLKYCEVNSLMEGMKDIYVIGNDLYANTWIGRDSSYVLPGIGCTVEQSYRMFNNMLSKFTHKTLPGVPYDYVPNLDFSYYKTDKIDEFIKLYNEEKILICNGNVQSNQATNFDFTPVIRELSTSFPHKLFLLTTPVINEGFDNVFFTSELIGKFTFDLNEIAYLSKFCNTIIGRKSGPFVFTGIKDNWEDLEKTFISFTHTWYGSSFVVNQRTKAYKVWSDAIEPNIIFKIISKEIA